MGNETIPSEKKEEKTTLLTATADAEKRENTSMTTQCETSSQQSAGCLTSRTLFAVVVQTERERETEA